MGIDLVPGNRCAALAAALVLGFAAADAGNAATPARPMTPEDILSLRSAADVQISPDGRKVAFVITEPADPQAPRLPHPSNVWIVDANGLTPPHPAVVGLRGASAPRWSPDGRRLAFLSDRGSADEPTPARGTQIYVVAEGAAVAEPATSAPGGVDQFAWSPDGSAFAFTSEDLETREETARRDAGFDALEVGLGYKYTRLYVTRPEGGAARLLTSQAIDVYEFAWSPAGDELAMTAALGPRPEDALLMSVAVVRCTDGSMVRTLSRSVAVTGALRWSPDGRSISFFESPPGRPFASWLAAAPAGGGATRPLTREYRGTVLAAEWAPDSARLIARVIEGTQGGLASIDARTGALTRLADVAAGQWGAGLSTNGRATAYLAESPESPPDLWLLSTGSAPRRLTELNPQTSGWRLGAVREITWKNSRDGLTRRGVLLTPPDFRPGQPRPTVVEAHPGDTAYWIGWHAGWWDWAQLLASNGFVVFLPNTRGVTGDGWALHETTVEWGGQAFQDLMDGVDLLVAERIADPDRLGICGWSNGGFMTEYAVTHTTRFKAGVALSGHSDFFSLYGTSSMQPALRHAFGAGAHEDRTAYDEHSPIASVGRCRTPMLLLHGANDGGVPVSQAYEFFAGVRDAGVEAELVVFPRERHSIREHAHQLDLQRRVLAWFTRHLAVGLAR